ncbi:hypothetical protein LJY25_08435 [Hymenobacter sp. BT175]|uniref:hypothetical protein n=1 Tax=Hymenobacter translucens TaxID=2886507 RepID=UPI001D0ECF97|nr:hypothetical protein [Hymenobacter translucens]MCC2546468.1 hypothetical protein [Hymenobacter translucens]
MKGEKRPQMLLYLLIGALLLSTGLNAYFLLRLDARLTDQQVEAQLHGLASEKQQSVSLQLPAAPSRSDTVTVREAQH